MLMRPGLRFWLERQLIVWVYLAPGVRYTGSHQVLGWQWPIHHMQCKGGPVCKGDVLTLLEPKWDARRLRWCVCFSSTGAQSSVWVHTIGVGVSQMYQFNRCSIPHPNFCPGPHLWCDNVDLAYCALVVRPMKMICQGLHLQMAGSSCSHGTRWPEMWPTDTRNIFCIPSLICSGSSANG